MQNNQSNFLGCQKILIMLIPVAVYIQQLSLLILTKGLAQIDPNPPQIVFIMYYIYLGSVYIIQVLRVGFIKFLKGYSRGFWIHLITTIQLIIQIGIVIGAVVYLTIDNLSNIYWRWGQFIIFVAFWSLTIIIRFFFVLLIIFQVLKKDYKNMQLKQIYWLTLTTKQELFNNHGSLNYNFRQVIQNSQDKLLKNSQNQGIIEKQN